MSFSFAFPHKPLLHKRIEDQWFDRSPKETHSTYVTMLHFNFNSLSYCIADSALKSVVPFLSCHCQSFVSPPSFIFQFHFGIPILCFNSPRLAIITRNKHQIDSPRGCRRGLRPKPGQNHHPGAPTHCFGQGPTPGPPTAATTATARRRPLGPATAAAAATSSFLPETLPDVDGYGCPHARSGR